MIAQGQIHQGAPQNVQPFQFYFQPAEAIVKQEIIAKKPETKDACNSPIYFSDDKNLEESELKRILKEVCQSYKDYQ